MSSEVRKTKRATTKAQNKELDILRVTRKGYIGSMYVNGVTLYLTTTHAVLSRAYSHNVFMLGSPNYSMLKYIYELNDIKEKTEEENRILDNGKLFILSFMINDFAGDSLNLDFNFKLFELYLMKVNHESEEAVALFLSSIAETIKSNNELLKENSLDQSDLESEEVEIKNMLDLNHVREGFNMVDSIPDKVPSEETK